LIILSTADNNATIPVRNDEELDWQALDRLLKSVIPDLEGEATISQFPGGNSNLTYRLEYANQDLVLRRPPFGTKAKSAHSMIREYRIMNELKPVYPSVPDTLCYSDDESIIGSEFYVMRKVEGSLVRNRIPHAWNFSPADTRQFCTRFWDKLIELHKVDYMAAGLGDFGKAEGYVKRQILGWNQRYEKVITPDADRFSGVRDWLEGNMPSASHYAKRQPSPFHSSWRLPH
jgi:aminoglycoside phosphotransferase (APT) family kinase protein